MNHTIDIARARADTPGCEQVLHFNNAGASLMAQGVLEAQVAYLRLEATIGRFRLRFACPYVASSNDL